MTATDPSEEPMSERHEQQWWHVWGSQVDGMTAIITVGPTGLEPEAVSLDGGTLRERRIDVPVLSPPLIDRFAEQAAWLGAFTHEPSEGEVYKLRPQHWEDDEQ